MDSTAMLETPAEPKLLIRLLRERDAVFEEIIEHKEVWRKAWVFLLASFLMMAAYGFPMGLFNGIPQAAASTLKFPLLFFLTLAICYPALFVLNNLFGSKIGFAQTTALILASMTYAGMLLAGFAPIVLLFVISGSDYAFLKLLHVAFCGIAAASGLISMYRGLVIVCEKHDVYPRLAMRTFRVWLLLFAFVGAQMSWNLRPFIGAKELPFQIFRAQEGNFYKAVLQAVLELAD